MLNKDIRVEDMAFSRLLPYIRMNWPDYIISKHHIKIAEHLEAVERGDIPRLIITMPPRSGKTMLASEFFPAWYLGRNPSAQIIYATYSHDRAADVGRKVRNLMVDPVHHQIFESCKISADSKGANKFSTEQGGNYFACGVGSAITGRGATVLCLDDLIKDQFEADSENSRQRMIEWFNAVAYTRLMDNNAIVLIMTRWRFDDIAGYLIDNTAHENWVVLNLPAIADAENDPIGRERGDALWPEKYPLSRLEQIRQTVGSRVWSAMYQGRPVPEGGGMVQLDWFGRYSDFDLLKLQRGNGGRIDKKIVKIIISCDTAYKQNQLADPSAFTVWALLNDNTYWMIDCINKKLEYPELKKTLALLYQKYWEWGFGPPTVLVEDKASGQSLLQDLKRYTKVAAIAIKPENSKKVRLAATTDHMEAGRVFLPQRAAWLYEVETQLSQFPYGSHDDIVDSISQFLSWITRPRFKRSRQQLHWK